MLTFIHVRRGFERLRDAHAGNSRRYVSAVLTLADLQAGESARIACVQCAQAARCERLQAYGLAQGQVVTLLQVSPAIVLRVDETELALDTDMARCVQVER